MKMATGETIGAEELGGARIHATVTGLADQIASDEYVNPFFPGTLRKYGVFTKGYNRFDAIQKAREWVATLNMGMAPRLPDNLVAPLPPRYPAEDILSIVNPDIRKPFDMREVLLRIVDDSRLAEFKPKYGTNMLTAWAHILGE